MALKILPSKLNNYNKIASYYDFLAKLVFGKSLINAQKDQLVYIPAKSKILIVGGGTGWILEEIANVRAEGLSIDYVEASSKMIGIAKKRKIGANMVNFLCSRMENLEETNKYDVVITPFIFDNFEEEQVLTNFLLINQSLKSCGYWLFSDFCVRSKTYLNWKNVLLRTMYLFFRLMAKVQTKRLIDIAPIFDGGNFELIIERWYYKKMIRAAVYQKSGI